jgi:phosphocarrier protein
MVECLLTIENRLGLHARPASLFVQTTNRYKSKIRVVKDDLEVDGKSIMGLLMLAAPMGTSLKIIVDGEDEAPLVESLKKLFASRFGEN